MSHTYMKRLYLIASLLTFTIALSAQTMKSKLIYYLDNYTRNEQKLMRSTLDSLIVDTTRREIRVYANGGFKEQYFTEFAHIPVEIGSKRSVWYLQLGIVLLPLHQNLIHFIQQLQCRCCG